MNSLTIKVYIASGYNANKGKLILNNVEYPFDNVMPDSDNAYELYFGFTNPITLPATGQLFITNASDEIEPFDHNGTIQVNQGYGIWNYDYNNPCYMEFELEEDGQPSGDPSIEFGSVSNPWYYNSAHVSTCNTPSYYELKCSFNYGGSVRPVKTFIRWGTNEPYTQITYGGVNPEAFSWQEQSVPYDEIGTLVVEFTDANNNGLTIDSYSSQDYVFDTDTAGSYGGTRLLIKSPDSSNIYEYSAGNFIECNITLENAQPSTPYSVDIITSGLGTVDGIHSGDQTGQYYLTAIPAQGWTFDHWTISGWDTQDNPLDTSFPDAHQTVYVYFVQEGPGPQPTEKHIYLCDNSGAHLAEMTNTGSTWNVTGSFTSGMYSVRATVEGEYDNAWFKFYQTSGDNRVFVGAGDDPDFEEIGTYILIDNILVSFSLVEDQETGYYVVNYQNTEAMTVSTVETIVNTYVGEMGFVTGSDIAAMSYITMTDIQNLGYIDQTALSSMSYITMADVQSLGYVDQNSLSNMSYVDQTSLSNMSYVDNSYLSTYMNNVVGNIESILQTI